MSGLGTFNIDDVLTLTVNTHTPSTGAATDADAVPAYRVYEDETGTAILTGNMAKLDDANTTGFYSEQLTLSAANGFENGKSYNVYISAAVGGVTGTKSHQFQVALQKVDTVAVSGDSGAADNLELFFDGTGYAAANSTIGTCTNNTDMRGTDSALLAASAPSNWSSMLVSVGGAVTVGTNTDKSGYSISGSKTTLDALNDISAASVNAQADLALSDIGLDHLISSALPTNWATDVAASSVFAELAGSGFVTGTDSNQAIRDHIGDGTNLTEAGGTGDQLSAIIGADADTLKTLSDQIDGIAAGSSPQLLQNTTIATLATQTSFTLTAGSADDDAYNGAVAIFTDQSTSTQKAFVAISDYVGSTKTVTLSAAPAFTIATGDTIDIVAAASDAPTAAAIRAEIDSNSTQLAAIVADTNELQGDWTNGGRLDLIVDAILVDTGTTLPASLTTITNYVDLIDDGTSGLAKIASDVAEVVVDTGTTLPAAIPSAATIADAVLDEATSGHTTPGSFAVAVTDILDDTSNSLPSDLATLSFDVNAVDGIVTGNAAVLAGLNDPTSAAIADAVWDEILADHSGVVGSVAEALSNTGGGGNVTVGDITAAALAKFITTDTLETTAAAGSVAKIAQGAAGGNVTVGAFTTASLAQFVTDDTGETSAASGSVADLSKSAADEAAITAAVIAGLSGTVVLSAPVATTGQITAPIVIGDDYLAANSRAFEWTVDEVTGVTVGTASCQFGAAHPKKGDFLVTGTITDNLDGTWLLSFDLTRSDTEGLNEGEYEWSVQVTDASGNEITRVRNASSSKVSLIDKQT